MLSGCRSSRFPEYPANYREYAYVSNGGADTISVLNLVDVRQETLLQVGAHPMAVLANPHVNEVYAVSEGSPGAGGSLAFIDVERNRVVATLPLGQRAKALAIDPNGERLYIANAGSNSVSVVDPRERRKLGVVGTGEEPSAIAVAPDNGTLVVANRQSGSVTLMGLSPNKLPGMRASFAGCPGAGSIAVLPDSSKAFVACSSGHQVMVLGFKHAASSGAPAEPDRLLAFLDVGQEPADLILKPDGGEIFVANQASDTVSEIATGTDEVGGASLIGSRPIAGVVNADNTLLWVANQNADTIAVYSIDDGRLIHTVHVGSAPGPLAFSADGHLLLAVDTGSGDLAVVRTFARNLRREPVYGSLFTLLSVGKQPNGIAVKAFRLTH